MKFEFITKNHIECEKTTAVVEASNIREAILKSLYVEGTKDEGSVAFSLDCEVESLDNDDEGVWISSNEELSYEWHLISE